jgi:tRNA A37 methylthiotransferase MiaB
MEIEGKTVWQYIFITKRSDLAGTPGERRQERGKPTTTSPFRFSAERGTPAAQFAQKVPAKVIDRRFDQLYKTCEKHSLAWANQQKGKIIEVQIDGNYVDESGRKEGQLFIGRTVADAPDIDPVVYVTGQHLAAGALIECEILETEGCDLVGAAI